MLQSYMLQHLATVALVADGELSIAAWLMVAHGHWRVEFMLLLLLASIVPAPTLSD